jgi:DNA-binding transcriptional ArsR family regulator
MKPTVEIRKTLPHKQGMMFSDAFMAIADPNRRYLLEELRRGPKTVNELAAGLPVSRPAVSQHLKVLLDAGLVHAKAEGTRRVYTVSNAGFLKLNIWLDQFWEA